MLILSNLFNLNESRQTLQANILLSVEIVSLNILILMTKAMLYRLKVHPVPIQRSFCAGNLAASYLRAVSDFLPLYASTCLYLFLPSKFNCLAVHVLILQP